MTTLARARTIGIITLASLVVSGSLAGCASGPPSAKPTPTASLEPAQVEYDEPEEGWCGEYGTRLNRWGGAALEIDEVRFDEVLATDFIGPADCYLELFSDVTTKSVVAVYLTDDTDVAEFITATLPDLGWEGAIDDPHDGAALSHPEIGDIGYSFSASAASGNIPADGPAIVVTLLLRD